MSITNRSQVRTDKTTTIKIVENLLDSRDYLRDDDERLVANTLYQFIKDSGKSPDQMSAAEFLKEYSLGNLPTADYITRVRRKLQEENPNLRGSRYKERQLKGGNVKAEINFNAPQVTF